MQKIEYKVAKDDLLRQCRKREKVFKRMFIYNLMSNHDVQVTQIGRLFNRNHASIINGLKTYQNLKSTKDEQLIAILSDYMKFFEQYDIKKIQYSIRKDLRNATTFRDIGIMRKRLESNLYNDLKK